jgi:xanthine dehydrogenase accessory factor
MVTVAAVQGSSPRGAGTRMVVTGAESWGTVGGGAIERRATAMARDMLAGGDAVAVRDLTADSDLGQACGGRLTLVFDRIGGEAGAWLAEAQNMHEAGAAPMVVSRLDSGAKLLVGARERLGTLGGDGLDAAASEAARRPGAATRIETHDGVALLIDRVFTDDAIDLMLFGAGHVGAAIVAVLASHPDLRITWVDDRPDLFPQATPANLEIVATDDPAGQVATMPDRAFVVVASHSHALDYDIVEGVLRRGDFHYCGLIGSRGKRGGFEKRWRERGLPDDALDRLVCPIGVAGITGRQPADIAVAVAAEILSVRDAARDGR